MDVPDAGSSVVVPYRYVGEVPYESIELTGPLPESLYGPTGLPVASDIDQDGTRLCPLHAALVGYGEFEPRAITDAIEYDEKSDAFLVTLYAPDPAHPDGPGIPHTLSVTRADIENNIARHGASRLDNTGGEGATWPAVLEVAHAKLHDSNHADGLDEGYAPDPRWSSADAMFELTGKKALSVPFEDDKRSVAERTQHLYAHIFHALNDQPPRPVVLDVAPERLGGAQDGLPDNHSLAVTDAWPDENGDVQIEVQNSWGHNLDGEYPDVPGSRQKVSLKTLVETDGHYLSIGAKR